MLKRPTFYGGDICLILNRTNQVDVPRDVLKYFVVT